MRAPRPLRSGLLQVINQRGEAGSFALGHPRGSRSMEMLEAFSNKFNPGSSWRAVWHPLDEGEELVGEGGDRIIMPFRTHHYLEEETDDGLGPHSLGYNLIWRKRKVRAELRDLPQNELDEIRARVGKEGITESVDEKWITVGGDGRPLQTEKAAGAKLLLHEATFLADDDYDETEDGGNVGHVHSTVDGALKVAAEAGGAKRGALSHLDALHQNAEIRDAVRAAATAAHRPESKGEGSYAAPGVLGFAEGTAIVGRLSSICKGSS